MNTEVSRGVLQLLRSRSHGSLDLSTKQHRRITGSPACYQRLRTLPLWIRYLADPPEWEAPAMEHRRPSGCYNVQQAATVVRLRRRNCSVTFWVDSYQRFTCCGWRHRNPLDFTCKDILSRNNTKPEKLAEG